MSMKRTSGALAFVVLCALLGLPGVNCHAQSALLDEVHTVAGSTVAVPVEHSFDISTPGNYKVTLVDLGAALTPKAPLASVKLAVTSGSSVVGKLTAAGTVTFPAAAAGTYVIHVIGAPGATVGSGPIGITVTDANNNQVEGYSDTLALPSSSTPSNEATLDDSFTVPSSGSYQVTLTDTQFPSALAVATLTIVDPTTGQVANSTLSAPGTATVSLQSGVTYRIFAAGQSGGALNAGLYGVNVSPAGGGTAAYSSSVPVGAVTLVGSPQVTAANYTLSVADLQFPSGSTLTSLGAEIMLSGQGVAQLTAAGSTMFQAAAATYQVFALGVPSTSGQASSAGIGSYSLVLQSAAGSVALAVARAVTAPGGTYPASYSFDTPVQAETYTLSLTDFQAPAKFTSLATAVVQSGAVVGTALNTPGTQSITPAAGPVTLLVFAQPAQSSASSTTPAGLFGISLTASGASAPAFQASQGVGAAFTVHQLDIATAGQYLVSVSDVGWPTNFTNLAAVVTQGTSQLGSILTGGSFTFTATPGTYYVNFIAQPGGADDASTYELTVGPAPPAPTLTFQANPTSVNSGSTTTLTWSSQNATSCRLTGGGGFSDTVEPASGTATSAALTSNTTFTLSCTGPSGTSNQTATVNVTATVKGGGGGGALDPTCLIALLAAFAARAAVSSKRLTGDLG